MRPRGAIAVVCVDKEKLQMSDDKAESSAR